jgi:hypothetical protein
MMLKIDSNAQVGNFALTINWSAVVEGGTPDPTPQTGSITLGLIIVQPAITKSATIVTPAGSALGGFVDFTVRYDGSFTVHFHLHDSGLTGYDFQVRAIFAAKGSGGAIPIMLVAEHSGSVGGTLTSGNRDDDLVVNGSNPLISLNWFDIVNGDLAVSKEYSATGVLGALQDLAADVLNLVTAAGSLVVGLVISLTSKIGDIFHSFGLGETFGVIGGLVVFAFAIASGAGVGAALFAATVAGVAIGAVTNALIKQRPINQDEYDFANNNVFKGALPPIDKIVLTNLVGLGGRPFTMPGVDNKIYICLGSDYDQALNENGNSLGYRDKGELLIHELTHAVEIDRSDFLPGFVCSAVVTQEQFVTGHDVYQFGPAGAPWNSFNPEQKAAIVDHWFAGIDYDGTRRLAKDEKSPFFPYIRNNVRTGKI